MDRAAWGDARAEWITAVVLIVVLLGIYATLLLPEPTVSWLIKEEHPIEGAGALALLGASILALLMWRAERRAGAPTLRVISWLCLALVFFVAFAEEISWGQRIFGIGTPESLESINDQGETNLHNLSTGTTNFLFQLSWLVMGVLIPVAALYKPARRLLERALPVLPVALALVFVANQVVIKVADRVFEAYPELYDGTKYSVEYGLYEIKESVVQITFAAAFWLLYRRARRAPSKVPDGAESALPRPDSGDLRPAGADRAARVRARSERA